MPAPTLEGIDPSVSQSSCIREDRRVQHGYVEQEPGVLFLILLAGVLPWTSSHSRRRDHEVIKLGRDDTGRRRERARDHARAIALTV